MTTLNIVSPEAWLEARRALLVEETAHRQERLRLAKKRRALPWTRVEKAYVFDGPDGPVTLADLFDGRSQLIVYHFMFAPEWEHGCPGCSLQADHIDGARIHFENGDVSFAAVSRAPIAKLEAYRRRMAWGFRWVSSSNTKFSYDYQAAFRPEAEAATVIYNFAEQPHPGVHDLPGTSVFARGEDGAVYHTYSVYGAGGEGLVGLNHWLDLAPKGHDGKGGESADWFRRRDEYGPRG